MTCQNASEAAYRVNPIRARDACPAYRIARQRAERAAIVAALASGRTAREIVGDDEDEGEEQGDD